MKQRCGCFAEKQCDPLHCSCCKLPAVVQTGRVFPAFLCSDCRDVLGRPTDRPIEKDGTR